MERHDLSFFKDWRIFMKEAKRAGYMRFELDDDRDFAFNESTDLTYTIYLEDEEDELLDINKYVNMCRFFAAAVGFAPETIDDAFGIE